MTLNGRIILLTLVIATFFAVVNCKHKHHESQDSTQIINANKHRAPRASLPPSRESVLKCDPGSQSVLRQSIDTSICSIYVYDIWGNPTLANIHQFKVDVENGQLRALTPENKWSKILQYEFTAPPNGSVSRVFARVDGKSPILGSPVWWMIEGAPTEKTTLSCNRTVLRYSENTTCFVSLKDSDGNPTAGFGRDFWTSDATGNPFFMYRVNPKLRENFYFTYVAPPGAHSDLLNVTLRSSGNYVTGSPQPTSIFDWPSPDHSQVTCEQQTIAPGQTMHCTILLFDMIGQKSVARTSELFVSANAGSISRVVAVSADGAGLDLDGFDSSDDPIDSQFSFTYSVPDIRLGRTVVMDMITVSLSFGAKLPPAKVLISG